MDSDDTTPPNATLSEKRLPEEARADGILPPEKRQKMDEGNHEEVKAASSSQTQGKAGESSKAGEAHPSRRGKYKITTRREAKEKKKGETLLKKRRGTRPEGEPAPDEGDKGPRLPKRASALLIGFCGAGYSGMQIQKDVRTIEGTLFEALVKAGAVSKDNADDPVKVGLNRAARTDAGVHAAGNLVNMKLITEVPGVPDIVARINEELPPEIRLWQIVRVQNSFNARSSCDSRKYAYYFPSYLLIPPKIGSGLQRTLMEQAGTDPSPHPFWSDASESSPVDDLVRKRQWRAPPEIVGSLRTIAQKYEGSHNFHNFTVGREFSDRSTSRFMKKIEVSEPTVHGETEWISVRFHGQSFMLHQRKMMAALVLACRTGTPPEIIEELYGPRILFVPKMPALGLLLEYPIFESYNNKIEAVNATVDPSSPHYRPLIEFDPLEERMEAFKEDFIYPRMRSIEDRDAIFDAWMQHVDEYTGNDLLYLNPKGIIPPNAVIKKTERRANPFRERRRYDNTTFPEGAQRAAIDEEEDEDEDEEEKLDKKALDAMEG